ncbi:hypothetical protein CAPTEDRAFT_205497 [Capitella teleta]|uniref:VWFD domain-containing protein n=1 Tax=Capitella teleta TaxID=283909 RepID=R7V6L1_CAPTE|nr:hypothetical protein CAPTEDRAFT_205497 [Capitella teleta]|eukprot:ELU12006.1 hypothetical protein CAPTEDRAFT_205497 [Capitella teleta]
MKETYLILLVIFSSAPEHVLSYSCDQDQTAINSPWLFSTTKTCPDLISGIPDYYNDIYRSECQRQLGLDEKPDSVPRANVEECYNLNNGTFKYRSTVCCPGTLQDTRCFTCNNISIEWDSQVCATVYHYVHGRKVDKMCMDEQACTAATNNNGETCVSGIAEPKCTYCCENPLCNYHKSVPNKTPGPLPDPHGPCDTYSYNCYNKSSCVADSDASYGYRCTACSAGRYGDRCQYTYGVCNSTDYCKNGGVCYDHENFGLRCQCPVGFHGSQCEFEALGADRCSHPELYYKTTSTSSSTSSGDCTSRAIYFAEVTAKSTSYGRSCVSYMGQGYRAGIDGGAVTHPESMEYYRCEKGEIRLKYAYDICCPSCTRNPCQNGGWCVQKGIQHVCRCRLGFAGDQCQHNEALSVISGDPHVLSFDKRNLHPQGQYQMAASEDAAATFAVFSKFERRGTNMNVSYVKYTEVDVYEHNVRLDRHNIVYVDGEFVDPMTNPSYVDGKLKVTMNGNYVRVETDFGLSVEFDGEWTALVKVPGGLLTSGLAGNNNGDPSDDMVTKDGVDVSGMDMSQSILANSWQVHDPEDPECQKEEVPDLKECDEAMEQKISSDNGLCGLIFNPTQPNNPFANCLASPLLNGDAFAENCLFDVCALQDDVDAAKQAACGSLEALTAQCKSLGIIIDWREAAQCREYST